MMTGTAAGPVLAVQALSGDYFGTYSWTPGPTGRMDDWNRTKGEFQGWATYLNLGWQFTPQWDASVGVRYNRDEKKMCQEVLTGLNPSPVLGNRVQGGFNSFNVDPGGPWGLVEALPDTHVPGSFDGEEVVSYEIHYDF